MGKTITQKSLASKDARTTDKMLRLQRDNVRTVNSWLLVEEDEVTIANQRDGEASSGRVTLSRREFERFIAFYLKPQKLRRAE